MHGTKPFPLQQRLALLNQIMLRTDLSTAELRIVWFLLIDRTNETGHCHCSNNHISEALALTRSTVHRAKLNLKQKQILTWPETGKLAASTHLATEYRFLSTSKGLHPRSQLCSANAASLAAPTQPGLAAPTQPATLAAPTQSELAAPTQPDHIRRHLPAPNGSKGFYAQWDSPEWNYWDAFLRKTTGKGALRDKRGGWHFPTQWPEENQH